MTLKTTWNESHRVFSELIRTRKFKVGVEVGVAFGEHIEVLLSIPTIKKMYGVDPYEHMPVRRTMNLSQTDFDELYISVLEKFANCDARYKHIRKRSVDAPDNIPEQVDFVYIDADHSYEGVLADLCAWFPKVREGGIIGGHDYGRSGAFLEGVTRAVDRFFGRFSWRIHTEKDYVWWIEKRIPNISFITPAYNCALIIEESIESIYNGNFECGDELIITDDASTDNTESILKKLKSKYPAIKLLKHDKNRGGSAARNTAIPNAKNPLLFMLDSDNVLIPGSIHKLKRYLLNSDADVVAFREAHCFKKNTNKVEIKWVFRPGIVILADCLCGGRVPTLLGNYMFTKNSWERAGGYPVDSGGVETWGFGIRQLATGCKMAVIPDSFYYHRYGWASQWVRSVKARNISLVAFPIIKPFLDLFYEEDVNYILNHKDSWLFTLSKHPIRVKGSTPGKAGVSFRVKE